MPKEYVAIDADSWQTPKVNGYRVACCDCGLVHELDFRIRGGKVQYRVRRNNRATAAKRRFMANSEWREQIRKGAKHE
jgi:hypothetical protein